jgi:hypothetical protein
VLEDGARRRRVRVGGIALLLHRLLAALGEAEEEGQHPGHDEQVLRRARLDGDGTVSILRCYARRRKVEVRTDRAWEEFSDGALLALIARADEYGRPDCGRV